MVKKQEKTMSMRQTFIIYHQSHRTTYDARHTHDVDGYIYIYQE